jgi:hypothetical protein
MPPLAGIAVAAIASSGAVGTALGLGTSIFGVISGGIASALEVGTIVGDVVAGAVVGAASGSATAGAAGTDPGNGALWGAITGGAGQALTTGIMLLDPNLSETAAQAISSGVVTTGAAAAQGAPLDVALQAGLLSGAGSYAGSKLTDYLSGTPTSSEDGAATTNASSPSNVTTPTNVAPASSTAPAPGESVVVPEFKTSSFNLAPSTSIYQPGVKTTEAVTREETKPSRFVSQAPTYNDQGELVTVEATKDQGNVADTTPSILDLIQQDSGTRTLEKGALTAALFNLLFPQGGGAPGGRTAGRTSGTTGVAGTGGAGGGAGAAAGKSPAGLAAQAAQVGQTGGTSAYGPGGPVFGEPGGATKYSPWNVASLRTDQGNA